MFFVFFVVQTVCLFLINFSKMADIDSIDANVVVEQNEVLDTAAAIQKVLKYAQVHDGIRIGIREVIKAIESNEAKMCVLSDSCSEPAYKKLVIALAKEKNIPLFTIANDSKDLGHWAGLYKLDQEGNARKIVGASSVAVVDFGEESNARDFLLKQKPVA